MKILILGGHGFVGKNVVRAFEYTKQKIYPLSRRDGLDLTDYPSTKKHFSETDPDIIINCAALVGSLNYVTQKAADVVDINMRMLSNMYKAVEETNHRIVIINPVANCAFPGDLKFYTEDSLWNGKVHQSVFAYGNTRRMILVLSDCYSMQYGIRSINFFVPNMYGSYDSTDPNKAHALDALVSKVVKAKKGNIKEIEVWGTGTAVREWLFAEDFAKVLVETIGRINDDKFNRPINIAQNWGLSIKDLLGIIIDEAKYMGNLVWNKDMPDGALRKVMDDKRFRKVFPNFEFTDIKEGIKKTIKYYESIYPY